MKKQHLNFNNPQDIENAFTSNDYEEIKDNEYLESFTDIQNDIPINTINEEGNKNFLNENFTEENFIYNNDDKNYIFNQNHNINLINSDLHYEIETLNNKKNTNKYINIINNNINLISASNLDKNHSQISNIHNISSTNNNINIKDNIKVVARIRPRNHKECESFDILETYNNTIRIKNKNEDFYFDYVATEGISQEEVFDKCAKEVADNFLQGYNGTIFAYGQTSAGKTYTLIGSRENIMEKNNKNINNNVNYNTNLTLTNNEIKKFLNLNSSKRGIIPRAIEYIIEKIEKNENATINLSCSFLEIYNEELRDLLDEKGNMKKIEIREVFEAQEEDKINNNFFNNNIKSKNNFNKTSSSTLSKNLEKKNEKGLKIININNLLKLKFENYNEAIQYLSQGNLGFI